MAYEGRVYGIDVLGKRCMVIFTLEENGAEQSFRGVVDEFRAKRRRDGSIERKHLVTFDDGESKWLDLAEEEKSESLGWMSGDVKYEPMATPPHEFDSFDVEGDESLDIARNVTPADSSRGKNLAKRLSRNRESTRSRAATQKRSGGIRTIQIPGSSSSEPEPERANKRRRYSKSPPGIIRHQLLDEESNSVEKSKPLKSSEGIKQIMTSTSTEGKHLLFREQDREHVSELNFLAGQNFWFFRQLKDPEEEARYFFCVHCGHQRRCRNPKDLATNFHQLRRHLESCKATPPDIRVEMESNEKLKRATNWIKLLGKRWNTDLSFLDGDDLVTVPDTTSDTSMTATEAANESASDEVSGNENDDVYDGKWDFIRNGKVPLIKMYQVMKGSTDEAITRAFVRFEAPSREFRVRKIINVIDRFEKVGYDPDLILESMEAERAGKSIYSYADEVTKFTLKGSGLTVERQIKKSSNKKQAGERKGPAGAKDDSHKHERSNSYSKWPPSHRGRVSQEDIIGDFKLSRPEDRKNMSELNYLAGEQFYFCKEVDCENNIRFLVCIHCLQSRSIRGTKDLTQNFHQYVKRHVEICKNVPDTVQWDLNRAVKTSTHWNYLTDRWQTDLCVLMAQTPSSPQKDSKPALKPADISNLPPDYLKTWDFVQDGKVSLIKMHFVMTNSTREQVKLAFRQLGTPVRQWRIKKIITAIAGFVAQGYPVDTVLKQMEAARERKSLYSFADEVDNFRIQGKPETVTIESPEGDTTGAPVAPYELKEDTTSKSLNDQKEETEQKEETTSKSLDDQQEETKHVQSMESPTGLVVSAVESSNNLLESEHQSTSKIGESTGTDKISGHTSVV